MFARGFAACLFIAAELSLSGPAQAQTPGIMLADALRRAQEANPDLRIARSEAAAAQGIARGARRFTFNPEVGVEIGRLRETGGYRSAYSLGLSQRFELGGKRGSRIRAEDQRRSDGHCLLPPEQLLDDVQRGLIAGQPPGRRDQVSVGHDPLITLDPTARVLLLQIAGVSGEGGRILIVEQAGLAEQKRALTV